MSEILADELIIEKYQAGESAYNISKVYNININHIRYLLKKFKIKNPKKLDEDSKLELINLYISGVSSTELGLKYNLNPSTIRDILKSKEIKIRDNSHAKQKYKINENYFDNIDTEDKAYFLGFLYADGCNCIKTHNISIGLIYTDKYILERFSKLIYQDYKKLDYVKEGKHNINGKEVISKPQYKLIITNKHMSGMLNSYGIVPAKSLKLTFPNCVPKELYNHFIRGYFDGDGSVSIRDLTEAEMSFVGTKEFLTEISNIIEINTNITSHMAPKIRFDGLKKNTYQMSFHGRWKVSTVLNWMYNESSIHLDRKYNKYLTILDDTIKRPYGVNKKNIPDGIL